MYQSSIISQILGFIHRMVTIFSLYHVSGDNRELHSSRVELYFLRYRHILSLMPFSIKKGGKS